MSTNNRANLVATATALLSLSVSNQSAAQRTYSHMSPMTMKKSNNSFQVPLGAGFGRLAFTATGTDFLELSAADHRRTPIVAARIEDYLPDINAELFAPWVVGPSVPITLREVGQWLPESDDDEVWDLFIE